MSLKMYEFEGGETVWVCAENESQAIDIYTSYYGVDVWKEGLYEYGDKAVREMDSKEIFTYYDDTNKANEDTIENHIKKYCEYPRLFATSIF